MIHCEGELANVDLGYSELLEETSELGAVPKLLPQWSEQKVSRHPIERRHSEGTRTACFGRYIVEKVPQPSQRPLAEECQQDPWTQQTVIQHIREVYLLG